MMVIVTWLGTRWFSARAGVTVAGGAV